VDKKGDIMRAEYHKDLKNIEYKMLIMATKARYSIVTAMEGLLNRNLKLSNLVVEKDCEIDNLEIEIETDIVSLITLQQPVAKDFRRISSVFKIITDLERIGDLSVNIAKISIEIGDEEFIKPLIDIPEMYKQVKYMLDMSLESFVNSDIELAVEIAKADDIVDDFYDLIHKDLLEMIYNDSRIVNQAIQLLFITRYLERMADHVINICQRVIYIETNTVDKGNS
jgi:phosphate transport system protein